MKFSFPWLAAGIGLTLAVVLVRSGSLSAPENTSLPTLTRLFISEFGFMVTAAGGYVAGKSLLRSGRRWSNLILTIACLSLSIAFFTIGILIWQGSVKP